MMLPVFALALPLLVHLHANPLSSKPLPLAMQTIVSSTGAHILSRKPILLFLLHQVLLSIFPAQSHLHHSQTLPNSKLIPHRTTTTVTTMTNPALGATFPSLKARDVDAPKTTAAPDHEALKARAVTATVNFSPKCTEFSFKWMFLSSRLQCFCMFSFQLPSSRSQIHRK